MVEVVSTRAVEQNFPRRMILDKETRGVKFHINIIIISEFLAMLGTCKT